MFDAVGASHHTVFACVFILFACIEMGSYYVALAVLELTLYTRLATNSQRSTCLCLPSAGIKAVCHHSDSTFKWLLMLRVSACE